MTDMHHADWCPRTPGRVETTEHPTISTLHCLDCGAHHPPADALAEPVTGALAGSARTWHDGIGLHDPSEGQIDVDHHNRVQTAIYDRNL